MPKIIEDKIRIGVSACNFGAQVRYNRRGWDRVNELGRERDDFIWTPVCPEVLSGLGVPRLPMKLTKGSGDDFWQGRADMKNRQGRLLNEQVKQGCMAALNNLKLAGAEAFVYMDGSPSCGVYRTTLKDKRLGRPPGVFGSLLFKEGFFLIPAIDLDSPLKWWDWRRRLHAFIWVKRQELHDIASVHSLWHDFKFICQELAETEARELGREISETRRPGQALREDWRGRILDILRRPSTPARISHWASKEMSFLCKSLGECYLDKIPTTLEGKKSFVAKLSELEQRSVSSNLDLGFSPVLYRKRR